MMQASTSNQSAKGAKERRKDLDSMEVFLSLRQVGKPPSAQTVAKNKIQALFDESETDDSPVYPDIVCIEGDVATQQKMINEATGASSEHIPVAPQPSSTADNDISLVRQLVMENKCMEMTMMLFLNPFLQNALTEAEQVACIRLMHFVLCGPSSDLHRLKDKYTDFFYEFENYKNAVGMGSPAVFNILIKIERILTPIREQIRSGYAATHVPNGAQTDTGTEAGLKLRTAASDQPETSSNWKGHS